MSQECLQIATDIYQQTEVSGFMTAMKLQAAVELYLTTSEAEYLDFILTQQDAIDISQLEKDLVNAKFEALSSSSNLTRMSRQSNVQRMLSALDSISPLEKADQPPYIIDVPQK